MARSSCWHKPGTPAFYPFISGVSLLAFSFCICSFSYQPLIFPHSLAKYQRGAQFYGRHADFLQPMGGSGESNNFMCGSYHGDLTLYLESVLHGVADLLVTSNASRGAPLQKHFISYFQRKVFIVTTCYRWNQDISRYQDTSHVPENLWFQ